MSKVSEKLHAMPEGPFAETETVDFIAAHLADAGFWVGTGSAQTGVVADLGSEQEIGSCGHDAQVFQPAE
ncbi:MAG: hypothetical protein VB144_13635 [Clostridia bacterium]|nr:hypothetical protein [Clostridia bacterium]